MSAPAISIVDINITGRCVFPKPRRPLPTRRELTGPIEEAWARHEPALSFSPVSQSRTSALVDPTTQTWWEIARTQPAPKTDEGWAKLSPYRPIRTARNDIPTEHRLASEAGITMLDIDTPLAGTSGLTVAALIRDRVTPDAADDWVDADDFDGPAPYAYVDPRTLERIQWEQMTTKSSAVTRIRRKWTGKRDIVVVDRSGVRMRGARLNGQIVTVFEVPKPYIYPKVVATYIKRIARANDGHFPTWAEQTTMAAEGRIAQQMRVEDGRPRIPLADREGSTDRLTDALDHAPFEERYSDDAITDAMAMRRFGRNITDLWPEEFDELMSEALRRLGDAASIRRYMRGHRTWRDAVASMPHLGEYLASDEEILS